MLTLDRSKGALLHGCCNVGAVVMMYRTLAQPSATSDGGAVHGITVPVIELQRSVEPDRMVKGCALEAAMVAVRPPCHAHQSTIRCETEHGLVNQGIIGQRSDRPHPYRHVGLAIALAGGIDEHLDRLVIPVGTCS